MDAWELARQNRITTQILQNYLEKRLFPQLAVRSGSKVPTVWEILPSGARRLKPQPHQNNIQEVIRDLDVNNTKEHLETVETEQISAFSDSEEGRLKYIYFLSVIGLK